MEDKKKLLENLLLDIDILNKLDKWTNNINLFEITGMVSQEIRHSNTLAWFLDANENHFLKDQFIRRFLQKVVSRNADRINQLNIFDVSLIDYSSFMVKREWKNIDILIYSNDLKMVFAIENKIYATESFGQLNKYYKIINDEFKDFSKMYIYLTVDGDIPSNENWCIADYKMVIETLEESMNASTTINNKIETIIVDYISMIRRNFGMDNELKRTAQKIYLKHKKAFDLIFEVTSNSHSQYSEYIKMWIEENKNKYNLIFDENYSTNTLIRFTTPFIEEMFPFDEEKTDNWKFGYSFMYEINIAKDGIRIWGTLSHFERPNSSLFMTYNTRTKSTLWRTVMPNKLLLSKDDISEGLTEKISDKLDNALTKAITKHLFDFENDIKELILERTK